MLSSESVLLRMASLACKRLRSPHTAAPHPHALAIGLSTEFRRRPLHTCSPPQHYRISKSCFILHPPPPPARHQQQHPSAVYRLMRSDSGTYPMVPVTNINIASARTKSTTHGKQECSNRADLSRSPRWGTVSWTQSSHRCEQSSPAPRQCQ